MTENSINSLYQPVPSAIEMRWINPENISGEKGRGGTANHGRKATPSPSYRDIKPGETRDLANYSGTSGIIRHIWTTTSDRTPQMNRSLRLKFYWDGSLQPAIDVPWSDFFGMGLGQMPVFESELFTNPEGRNANSYAPMPFKKGFRLTVTNETKTALDMFWMQIDFTINDAVDDALYLHAWFNRENPTSLGQDYTFLPQVQGCGRFLGVNFGVQTNETWAGAWWGEGEVKLYIDGDTDLPTLCGTGTEDYIGTAWGQGCFSNRYQGSHLNESNKRICMYRYHIPDPIWFHQNIRGTIQQIGYHGTSHRMTWNFNKTEVLAAGDGVPIDTTIPGHGLFERSDDWSSCAYIYLKTPENDFPELQSVEERIRNLSVDQTGKV